MERLIAFTVALMVYVALGVDGTAHLSFSNDTEVNITRVGCGTSKLCVETPTDCDPAESNDCLFVSAMSLNSSSNVITFELQGNSTGYVALGLTINPLEGTSMLFICAKNSTDSGTIFFRTMQRNNTNNELTPTETTVSEIRGLVKNDTVIQCEFNVPNLNASNTRSNSATMFSVLLGTGPVNGSIIGEFSLRLNSSIMDLSNPGSNVAPTSSPTTHSATTPNNTSTVQPAALLLLLSILSLLLRA